MYDVTIPVIIHALQTMSALLKKTEEHCEERKIAPDAILQFRLYPDMFPLTRQVMLMTDFAKGVGARLSGGEIPSYADTEQTFPELRARIEKCIAYLQGLDKEYFKASETCIVKVRVSRDETREMTGADYYNKFALPNFYFHMTTAYNILRHNGIELGKKDFMGR
jgi:uncharacterized protein